MKTINDINVAEILKNMPQRTRLYCVVYRNCILVDELESSDYQVITFN